MFWATSESIYSRSIRRMVKLNAVLILMILLILHAGQGNMVKELNEKTVNIIGLGKFETVKVRVTNNNRNGFLLWR